MLFPLYDTNPTRTFPYITVGLIALNILVFLYEVSLGLDSPELHMLALTYGAVPQSVYLSISNLELFDPAILSLFTSMFIHGDWAHVLGNMLYLWIFGNNVEDYFGHMKFLLFYAIGGVIAALAHTYFNIDSLIPTVGASGAVAAVLGAYIILYPRAQVVSLFLIRFVALPAVVILGIWFVFQLFLGVSTIDGGGAEGGVAWFAHIGGFVFGAVIAVLAMRMLDGDGRPRREGGRRPRYDDD